MEIKAELAKRLIDWHRLNPRHLPWKVDNDPYKVWVSEIILQQTRVAQGLPYYERFVQTFPDLEALASTGIDQVLRVWQGLGYYSRARNLHATAKHLWYERRGVFPTNYTGWIELKGIGPYTAAAISSFCFGEKRAVIDGNVERVLSRVHAIRGYLKRGESKSMLQKHADITELDINPGEYNQAIMDLGALVCVPKNPSCEVCPLQDICKAKQFGMIDELPAKKPKIVKKQRFLHYVLIQDGDGVVIKQRGQEGIWPLLYELPGLEMSNESNLTEWEGMDLHKLMEKKHVLTHQNLSISFYQAKSTEGRGQLKDMLKVPLKELGKYAFPRPISWFLTRINVL